VALVNLAAEQFKSSVTTTTGGFDWMGAFEKLNKAKSKMGGNNKKPEEPDVAITSISTTGLVTMAFSKKMVVPPLDMI
jgi:hypothetical protein